MEQSQLHQRLKAATSGRSHRALAELTGLPPETVRRYMLGQAPSVEFLTRLGAHLRLNGEWLLTGRGPMRTDDIRSHALREANAAELLNAMATTLERLIERVERVEVFLQTLEARLRAHHAPPPGGHAGDPEPLPAVHIRERAAGIADAIQPPPG
ncbi:MAG: helix-turn-helix transcriptional regulator [Phycisphaerales bacterium]|nr:helix-turn-helix transcriptional regulator [Phycisphaerales bacterium]